LIFIACDFVLSLIQHKSLSVSSLKFTIIQTALFWEDKGANLEALAKKIMAIAEPTEIIVLPEMFTTGRERQLL
jgi:predicted amidohydrolase